MKRLFLWVTVILLLAGIAGCSNPAGQTPAGPASSAVAVDKGDDPEAVFKKFIECFKNDDLEGAWGLLSKESKEAFKVDGQPSFEKFKEEIGKDLMRKEDKEKITSAVPIEVKMTASVKARYNDGQEVKEDTIEMVKEEGGWKLKLK